MPKMKVPGLAEAAKVVRVRRPDVVFVCRKCVKRAGLGKAIGRALKDAVARRADGAGRKTRKPRVVGTCCLGLCPKRSVVVASAASLARGEMVIVGGPDAVPDAVDRLLPHAAAPGA